MTELNRSTTPSTTPEVTKPVEKVVTDVREDVKAPAVDFPQADGSSRTKPTDGQKVTEPVVPTV